MTTPCVPDPQSLRVLVIGHFRFRAGTGAGGATLLLVEALRERGHVVDVFDEASARRDRPAGRLHQLSFARAAARHVRAVGNEYDVVDAHLGCLTAPKARLGLRGVLSTYSQGYPRFHRDTLRGLAARHPTLLPGTRSGRLVAHVVQDAVVRAAARSLALADLVRVQTEDERQMAIAERPEARVVVTPNGLTVERARALASVHAVVRASAGGPPVVVSVGAWQLGKGRADWPSIVRETRALRPDVRFRLLGTGGSRDDILAEFGDASEAVDVVEHFDPDMLPELLSNAVVGVHASYTEGLPVGVLEMTAAGIPVVAYDAPGARAILSGAPVNLLVRPDPGAVASRVADLVCGTADALERWCVQRASAFDVRRVAADVETAYLLARAECVT